MVKFPILYAFGISIHQVQTTPKAEHAGVLDNSTHFFSEE
jgi:hypothetical protein